MKNLLISEIVVIILFNVGVFARLPALLWVGLALSIFTKFWIFPKISKTETASGHYMEFGIYFLGIFFVLPALMSINLGSYWWILIAVGAWASKWR